jgi:hypothetical protein
MRELLRRVQRLEEHVATGECVCNLPPLVIREHESELPPSNKPPPARCPVHKDSSRLIIVVSRVFGRGDEVEICAT